jgi:hypothetical protein
MHYLPRKFPRTILAGLVARGGAVAAPVTTAAAPAQHAGYVYVNRQLTELGSVALPAGATPAGVAVK